MLAFAKLEFDPGDEVLEGLAGEALLKITTFSPQAHTAACRTLSLPSWPGLTPRHECTALQCLPRLVSKLGSFRPALQALANTLWGLSRLGIKANELMEGIGQAARTQLFEYNSQNLANSVRIKEGGLEGVGLR